MPEDKQVIMDIADDNDEPLLKDKGITNINGIKRYFHS